MARPLDNPLQVLAERVLGTPTSPLSSRSTPALRQELADAWAQAPTRYRNGVLSSVYELISRHPTRLSSLLEEMPFIDWTTGRGTMPLWAEWFLGIPEFISHVPMRVGIAGIKPDLQAAAWQSWMNHARPKADQLLTLCAPLDPFNEKPQTLSSERALAMSHLFREFLLVHEERSDYRESMIRDVFLPITNAQPDAAMSSYLAGALAPCWVSDKTLSGESPSWESWMFDQSAGVYPNHRHRVDGKNSPPHLYGLPEYFFALLFHRQVARQDPIALPIAVRACIDQGMETSLRHRQVAGAPHSPWLPSAQALCDRAPAGSPLRAFLKLKIASISTLLDRPAVPVETSAAPRRRLL